MGWRRAWIVLVALAIIAGACGDDSDGGDEGGDGVGGDTTDAPADDDGDGGETATDTTDTTGGPTGSAGADTDGEPEWLTADTEPVLAEPQEFATAARLNQTACLAAGDDFSLEDAVPEEVGEPPMPPTYQGPLYRPGILIGPGDTEAGDAFDPRSVIDPDEVQLARVDLTGDLSVGIDSFNNDNQLTALGEDAITSLNRSLSVWWIVSADSQALLDPANVVRHFGASELSPAFLMIPGGGHMYGPEGNATELNAEDAEGMMPDSLSDEVFSVGVIDTSFTVDPDPNADPTIAAERLAGHGSFIVGIISQRLPNATVTTVDMGPEGQNLADALAPALGALYANTDPLPGPDTLQLGVLLAGMGTGFDAINMSFGTYHCPGVGDGALERLRQVLRLVEGVPVFAAAGNDADPEPWYPAGFGPAPDPFESWITSIGGSHEDGDWAGFSNRGPWVEYCADATDVVAEPHLSGGASGTFFSWNGTSFATPHALTEYLAGEQHTACPAGP